MPEELWTTRFTILPTWLDTRDPEAIRGTARVRTVDANLIVGVDRRFQPHRFQIWGPRYLYGGWGVLTDVQDDQGRFLYPPVPWEMITAMLLRSQKASDNAVDRIEAHNERIRQQQTAALRREQNEAARYAQRAVGREAQGDARWDAEDLLLGWRNVVTGQGKAPPKAQKIYVPGVQP